MTSRYPKRRRHHTHRRSHVSKTLSFYNFNGFNPILIFTKRLLVPQVPRRRRASTSFFMKQKTAAELREELSKLVDDAKREQDSWKMEEARLKMKMGTKPEEIERVRRKQRASAEKYTRKIEATNIKLSIALAIEQA